MSTDDDYSFSLAELFINSYEDRNGTVLKHISYVRSAANTSTYFDMMNVLATSGAPVIVLITTRIEVQNLLAARTSHPVMRSDKFLWAGADDWIGSDEITAPTGTIGLVPQPLDMEYTVGTKFIELWKALDPIEYPDADGDRSSLSTYAGYAVDAVFGMALAHQAVIDSNFEEAESERGREVYSDLLSSVSFIGVTGQVDFDASGDRLFAHYDILNVDAGGTSNWVDIGYTESLSTGSYGSVLDLSLLTWPDGSVGSSSAQDYSKQYIPYCPPGYEPILNSANRIYSCSACGVGYYKPYPGQEACSGCPEGADCEDIAISVPCVLPGYWRPQPPSGQEGNFDKYEIFECDRADRCNGGCNLNATCADDFKQDSPVCGVCKEGFYQSSFDSCSKCPANVEFRNAMEILFIVLCIGLGVCLLFGLYIMYVASVHDCDVVVLITGKKRCTEEENLTVSNSSGINDTKLGTFITVSRKRVQSVMSSAKSSGLFVTVKLTVSFVQVLVGKL